jgi:hypothetical protein
MNFISFQVKNSWVKKYLKGSDMYCVTVSAVEILMSSDKLCMIKIDLETKTEILTYNKIHYCFISFNEGFIC